jgi:GTP-binding protein YchF
VGKSTLFNALTKAGAEVGNYPFTTTDKNVGIVSIPDERLNLLKEILHPEKLTPATIEFVDIAGLVRGSSKGEGLGNRFLAHIREVDCVLHLIRGFHTPDVPHIEGNINPLRDIEVIQTELSLADIETLERRIEKLEKGKGEEERNLLNEAIGALSRNGSFNINEFREKLSNYDISLFHSLLSSKPSLFVLNVDEVFDANSEENKEVVNFARSNDSQAVAVSLKIEEELTDLDQPDRDKMRQELGLFKNGLEKLILKSFELLDLITFYTIKGTETKAWNISRGSSVLHAAGKIHTDMEKGFIRAEVVQIENLQKMGSMNQVKEKGELRTEGKDYIVQDGDILLIKFR